MARSPARGIGAGVAAAALLPAITLTPAAAQEPADPDDPSRVPSAVASDGLEDLQLRVLVENDGEIALDGVRVVVEIHSPGAIRSRLRQALEGDLTSAPLPVRTSAQLSGGEPLQTGEVAGVAERVEPGIIRWSEGAGGVYPVRIAVARGTTALDEAVTAVVWLGRTPGSPLLTTLVWPLDTAPWRTTGGAYPDTAGRETRPGERLDALPTAAENARGDALVLAPAAHLLEDLSDRSDGFATLVQQDGGALETQSGSNSREFGGIAAAEGRRRVRRQLATPVDAGVHLVDGPISPAVLDLLPGDAVLLPFRATVNEPSTPLSETSR